MQVKSTQRRPNIVLILTDDMGYDDLPAYGDSKIPTPAIDRLCREGTKFTDSYVCAPICVPSRMGLMTGRHHQRWGIYDNIHTPEENRLWVGERTLADILRSEGHRTGLVGKWHSSGNSLDGWKFTPRHKRGLEEFVGIAGGLSGYWEGTKLFRLRDGEYDEFASPGYLTDFFGHEAEQFIDRHHDRPFFLFFSFNAPHAPMHGLEADQKMITATDTSPERHRYAAMVYAIDRNVGRVLTALDRHGIAENTLFLFLNDNGGGGSRSVRETVHIVPVRVVPSGMGIQPGIQAAS
jgi:arylsulfatase A-like enzyme